MLIIRVDYDADPRLVDKSALAEHQQWVEILSEQKNCPPTANAHEDYKFHLLNYRLFSESLQSLQSDGRVKNFSLLLWPALFVNRSRQLFQGCVIARLQFYQDFREQNAAAPLWYGGLACLKFMAMALICDFMQPQQSGILLTPFPPSSCPCSC